MPIPLPTADYLAECFSVSDAGVLTWRIRQFAGQPAGRVDPRGYVRVKLDGKTYAAHRIVWKMTTGEEPGELDHIDRCRSNNSPSNLRAATRTENCRNKGPRSDNTSGLKGVSPHRSGGWRARIHIDGKSVSLGRFATPEEASVAYMVAHADAFGIESAIAPHHREGMEAALVAMARADVQAGKRTIPGFDVVEDRRAF